MPTPMPLCIVPFSHLDLFWGGAREECLTRGVFIIRTALEMLEKYPDYRFMVEAVNFMEFYLDSFPEETERIRDLIESGRLEVIPVRSITYTHQPSGETWVRNIHTGRDFCLKHFGMSSKILSVSDIPGISPQMPQIALKSGMDVLFLSHGCPSHTDHIIYTAPDGSSIRSYAPLHYARCRKLLSFGIDYGEMLAGEEKFEEYFSQADYRQICQWGTDLCVIPESVINNIQRWNTEGHRKLEFCTYSEFFAKYFPDNPKEISGEIPSLWPNVESSWPDIWPLDLPCENAMFTAEFFGTLIPRLYPREAMTEAWHWLLDGMDHNQNGVGGTWADRDKLDCKLSARAVAEQATKRMAWALAAKTTSPHTKAFPIVVFNPLGWRRTETIRAHVTAYGPHNAALSHQTPSPQLQFRLIDGNGNPVPFKTITSIAGLTRSFEFEFLAENIPAFGAGVYYLEEGKALENIPCCQIADGVESDRLKPNCEAGSNRYENRFFILEIDRVSGELTLFDKTANRCLFNKAGLLGLEEKRGDYICNMELTGRVIPALLETIELLDNNAVYCRIRLRGSIYSQSFTQTITMVAEQPVIDIEDSIDWQGGKYVRIEQAFPFAGTEKPVIRYGVPFGAVTYPETIYDHGLDFAKLATPERSKSDDAITRIRLASKWISINDTNGGVTIAADHRMWELDGSTLRNCILRGIGCTSGGLIVHDDGSKEGVHRPPPGTYVGRFRIAPLSPGEIPDGRVGFELNSPLYPVGVGIAEASATPGQVSCQAQICNKDKLDLRGDFFQEDEGRCGHRPSIHENKSTGKTLAAGRLQSSALASNPPETFDSQLSAVPANSNQTRNLRNPCYKFELDRTLVLPVMPDSTGTGIIIANVKPSFKGNNIVFRCFETKGKSASLPLPEGPQWFETDLLEENEAKINGPELNFKPFEIKTIIMRNYFA